MVKPRASGQYARRRKPDTPLARKRSRSRRDVPTALAQVAIGEHRFYNGARRKRSPLGAANTWGRNRQADATGSIGVTWYDLGLPTTGERASLARRVREYLRGQDILLERLGPRQLMEKAMSKDEAEKSLADLYDAFLRYPHLPILESEDVLRRTITQGVREGAFGVRSGAGLTFHEGVAEYNLQSDSVLVRPEVAERELAAKQKPPEVKPSERGGEGGEEPETKKGGAGIGGGTLPPKEVTSLHLRVRVPWDKIADFLRGVVMPLRADGANLTIEITVDAESAAGIKKTTLEQKVDETLRQIGAQVVEDRQE